MKTSLPVSQPSSGTRRGKKRALSRVLCIIGPTASGKTALGVALAKMFQGEVINADARQVYRDFNIGTGKPSRGKAGLFEGHRLFMLEGVPHHLMDFLSPKQTCTVAQWRKKALQTIQQIVKRDHLPMVVGGTGLYIQALVDNYKIPSVPPQIAYRTAMASKSLEELVELLRHADPEAVKVVDLNNRRRVLRALEVVTFTGQPFSRLRIKARPVVEACLVGLARAREELHARIEDAVENMIRRGWVEEVRRLHAHGIPWEAPAMTSIGYRELSAFLRGECSLEEAKAQIKRATKQYAKRQLTWFNHMAGVHWVKDEEEAKKLVQAWLQS